MDIFPYSTYQIFDIGGLVGGVDDDVSDCYSTVDVVGLGDDTFTFGGVAGTVGGSVTRCFATGNVQAWMTVGGVAGLVGTRGGQPHGLRGAERRCERHDEHLSAHQPRRATCSRARAARKQATTRGAA